MRDVTEYPFVFFPVGLNLRGRRCVVIGNDREALEKAESLREVHAHVACIEDASQLRDEDVIDAFFVISTPQDSALSARLRALADTHRFLLCCIDQQRFGFIAMQAVVKAGPVRIAISTGGIAPRVGKTLKEALRRSLDARFTRFIACVNAQRERNRDRLSESSDRRAAMIAAAEGFDVDVAVRYPTWFVEEERALAPRPAGRAPSVEIVTIGTELLLGHHQDSNGPYIARAMADRGIDVFAKHSVGDNVERLAATFRGVLDRADGAIATGGLGPTVDDCTREAVARAIGMELVPHEPSLRAIEERFLLLGRSMSENNRRQAMFPRGSVVLENPHGTAPGFIVSRGDGKFIACMPGVPGEMQPMLSEQLLPRLIERLGVGDAIYTRTLHTAGVPESELDARIEDLFRASENPKIAMLAHAGRVDVVISAKARDRTQADAMIASLEERLRERIGAHIYGTDEETIESVIVQALTERDYTVVTAESITGGAVADALVRVPGASRCFLGGVTAYDNTVKTQLLGVDEELLRTYGAVSEQAAAAMARGARDRLHADFAIAVTGIAGPGGAVPGKPVGLVWFGLALPTGAVDTYSMMFSGDRDAVRRRAVAHALSLLREGVDRSGI